ncbi:hypothetical protein [Okeania sp. SIO2B3]|uniref:hypothetical protein n=1 Tax=Okeania sp. SIO2B3 TaxID=2607784 RepID=UPI0013C1DA60|nr:hypothetical protein [Okeania sp. SIO2B3]NET44670.1 hypothetical protein [Okeania sp. SIO2B3]
MSKNFEIDTQGGEVTLGWEKAGIGASVVFGADGIKISLGIGIAAVELDLGELNNSKVIAMCAGIFTNCRRCPIAKSLILSAIYSPR